MDKRWNGFIGCIRVAQRSRRAGACAMPEPIPINTRLEYQAQGGMVEWENGGIDRRWNGFIREAQRSCRIQVGTVNPP